MSEIEFTPEQQQELREKLEKIVEFVNRMRDALVEIVQNALERIREIAINFGRMFLKLQLLEWKIPHPIAEFISQKIYWYWAVRLGFAWLQRKLLLI